MNIVNSIKFESETIINILPEHIKFIDINNLISVGSVNLFISDYYIENVYYLKNKKRLNVLSPSFNGNGLLAGGTYINSIDNIFENNMVLYHGDNRVSDIITTDGKFNFKNLNTDFKYDIKAVPLNTDFNPRIVTNLKPVIDNSCFRFLFYCYHDKVYKPSIEYKIKTLTHDTRGLLKYNLDNAPTGLSIDEYTGVITIDIGSNDVYNFTANCSDLTLELTRTIDMTVVITDAVIDLPLTATFLDYSNGNFWKTDGDITINDGGALFSNGSNIYRDINITLESDFTISCEFIKYDLSDNDSYYATIFSAGYDTSKLSYIMIFGNGHADEGKIVYRIYSGTKIISNTKIQENVIYSLKITRVGNTISMYINDVLDVSSTLSSSDISLHNNPLLSPFIIGSNTWDIGVKKGSFGGIIKNFKCVYNE